MPGEEALAHFCKAYLDSASQKTLDKIKAIWLKKEYGIPIKVEEADDLKNISESEFFRLFKQYLGKHWSSNLIKVGLYVLQLNKKGLKHRVKQISDDAYRNKRYGKKGQKIIHLASIGLLPVVMRHIIDIKIHKQPSDKVLQEEWDKILEEWDKISVPVKNDCTQANLKTLILSKMKAGYPVFFVYAAASATDTAYKTIARMRNARELEGKYIPFPHHETVDGIDYCLWSFEKVEISKDSLISKLFK